LGEFVRHHRHRGGLSLREASIASERIAQALGDARFFCPRGTLAAWESAETPHLTIHRIFALCVLYRLKFWEVLGVAGLKTEGIGREVIPKELLEDGDTPTRIAGSRTSMGSESVGFLSRLIRQFQEIPFFLRNALAPLATLPRISLHDIFWLGERNSSLHHYLQGAVLAAVDRRRKKPMSFPRSPRWEQPIHLLFLRDGSYLCARCSLRDGGIVVHPFANGFERPLYFRTGKDAEIVGTVVALLRTL
jgi:hypothetical protein